MGETTSSDEEDIFDDPYELEEAEDRLAKTAEQAADTTAKEGQGSEALVHLQALTCTHTCAHTYRCSRL